MKPSPHSSRWIGPALMATGVLGLLLMILL